MQPNIVVYSTRVCPYCIAAKNLLTQKGLTFEEVWIDENPEQRQVMLEKSHRRSVPQIFIGETHIGGFDDLYAAEQDGRLDGWLKE